MTALNLSLLRTLRSRFALMMGMAGLLLGLVATGLIGWRLEADSRAAQRQAMQLAANQLGSRLAADLRARKREVVLSAGLLDKTGLTSPQDIRAVLETLKDEQPGYAWIGITDASGHVVAATGRLLEGKDASARPWFEGARSGLFVGDVHDARMLASLMPGPTDGEPLRFIDIAVPLRDEPGGVRGVLAAHLHWSWVRRVIAHQQQALQSPVPIEFIVADREGRILHSPTGESPATLGELEAGHRASGAYLSARSSPSVETSSELGWTILARQSMADVMAPIHRTRLLMLALAVALGAAFLALTWLVSKRVVRPIEALADAARRFEPDSATPFNSAAELRPDEVGSLARTIAGLVEKLRIHAGRNQLFIEHAPVPLAVFDRGMRYLTASRRWLADYGLEGRDVIGRSHYEVVPDLPEHWREAHRRALAGEVLSSPSERFTRSDGREQWIRWEVRPWRMPDGSIGGIAVFTEDISARVEAEHALRLGERRLRLATESAKIGIFDWDLERRTIVWTPELRAIYGWPTGAAESVHTYEDWLRTLHPDEAPAAVAAVQAALQSRDSVEADWRIVRPDGEVRWVNALFRTFADDDGKSAYMVGVNIDVTDRKAMEADLRRSATLLSEFNDQLKRQVDQQTQEIRLAKELAESASRAKSSFLANRATRSARR